MKVQIEKIEYTATGIMVLFKMDTEALEQYTEDVQAFQRAGVQSLLNMANNSVHQDSFKGKSDCHSKGIT